MLSLFCLQLVLQTRRRHQPCRTVQSGRIIRVNGLDIENRIEEEKNLNQFMKNKKAIALVLLIAMLFSILPTAALADTENGQNQNENDSVYFHFLQEDESITTASALLMNIAETYVNDASEWVILDMAAYKALNPGTENVTSDSAKQTYINNAIASITDSAAGETAYSKAILSLTALGIDPTQLYPVNSNTTVSAVAKLNALSTHSSSAWVAPYTFAAWQQGAYATETQESALINSVLANQNEDGSWSEWGDSIQTTANMIAGLSFYNNAEVTAAVEKAITYLSTVQKNDGSFDAYGYGPDANTSAMVVIALALVGIDPETDTRFIKNDVSALDSLLHFALADNSGFGYTDNTTWNAYATEQGFRALIAASQVMKTGKAYNVYDFSSNTLEPGRATGSGAVAAPSRPSGSNSDITVSLSIKGTDGYWLKNKSVTLKEGSTMYWALADAIEDTAITQTGAENGYVSEMSYNGKSLAEFDYGRNSGWLYKVNNTLPEVGLLEYVVKNGDVIEWYYTRDWTKDSLAGARVDNTDRKAAASVDELIAAIDLETISKNSEAAIKAAREAYDALTDEQKALVENYDDLVAAETLFASLSTELPFEDTQNHWAKDAIQYVYENGLMRGVSDTSFGPDVSFSRAMLVSVLHRMAGAPATNGACPFNDVRDTAWYANPVAWAYQNKLAGGISATRYAPETAITREQLAVMLMRFAQYQGYDTSDTIRLVHYKDAAQVSAYAEPAMKWAVSIGLISGRTSDTLAPQGTATRAEVAVILERFLAKFPLTQN